MNPYEVMFGEPRKVGSKDSFLLLDQYDTMETEEESELLLNKLKSINDEID